MVAAGFHAAYLNGPLPYVQRHITVNKNVLSASLNKTFPSFLPHQSATPQGVGVGGRCLIKNMMPIKTLTKCF